MHSDLQIPWYFYNHHRQCVAIIFLRNADFLVMTTTVPFTWVLVFTVQAWGFANVSSLGQKYSSMYFKVSTQKSSGWSVDTRIELDLAPGLYVLGINRFYRKFLLIHALSASRLYVFWWGCVSALPKADSSPQRAKQPLLQLLLNTRDLLKSVTSTHSTISHTCTISIATASENTPPPLVLNGFNRWWKEVLLFLLAKHLATVAQKSLQQHREPLEQSK